MYEKYWNSIPIGKENAVTYSELCEMWSVSERKARQIMHELSVQDSGDNFVLIRSGQSKGFYRTDDEMIIRAFKKECTNKAKSSFAPLRKINRILNGLDDMQITFDNNIKNIRLSRDMKQAEVVAEMRKHDKTVDIALLSKFENSEALPTPMQLCLLSRILRCNPSELLQYENMCGIV